VAKETASRERGELVSRHAVVGVSVLKPMSLSRSIAINMISHVCFLFPRLMLSFFFLYRQL
jgi:hypothetical protein